LKEKQKKNRKVFDYKSKDMMASIGKRNGVGELLGFELQGIVAWWIWRSYYLANLPTLQKNLRVMIDWTLDFFFKRDVTMLKTILEYEKGSDGSTRETSKQKLFLAVTRELIKRLHISNNQMMSFE
jgi:hypothetical protein